MRIRCVPLAKELEKIRQSTQPRNWSIPLRAPNIYFDISDNAEISVALEHIADVHLGYKSLQNQFFYLDSQTVSNYGIESEYLKSIFQLGDLNDQRFVQQGMPQVFLFYCDHPESDLGGTGALRYIRDMENKPAAIRKQTGQSTTISEALEKQGGTYWYGPKAIPKEAHIWIRKAFDKTYAPFIFNQPQILDQRCNYLVPHEGIKWQLVASIMTSSLFALSMEAAGSASMGAGVLEIPTTKLSKILVPDVRKFSPKTQSNITKLAKAVWEHDTPVNWGNPSHRPSEYLNKLDDLFLSEIGVNVTPEELYDAIKFALSARITVAHEKAKNKSSSETGDISSVAKAILSNFRSQIESIRFPESFLGPEISTSQIEIDPSLDIDVTVQPFLDQWAILISSGKGNEILNLNLPRPIAEVLIRAVLIGRRSFMIPTNPQEASTVLTQYWNWLPPLLNAIKEECASSSLGTRFEGEIEKEAMKLLNWSEYAIDKEPYGRIRLLHIVPETYS